MRWTAFVLGLLALWGPNTAAACGLTPPIGPNGLPTVCHGESNSIRLRAGLSVGGTSTVIKFGNERANLLQGATVATFDVHPVDRLGLSVAAGGALGGHVDFRDQRYTLRPGAVGGIGVSYRVLDGRGVLPFVHASATLSVARAATEGPGTPAAPSVRSAFTSYDWRFGLAVGKPIGKVAAPFAVARYFGAGTDWEPGGTKGSDRFRYHVGAGSAFAISEKIDLLTEVTFLGEKRLTLGAGYTF